MLSLLDLCPQTQDVVQVSGEFASASVSSSDGVPPTLPTCADATLAPQHTAQGASSPSSDTDEPISPAAAQSAAAQAPTQASVGSEAAITPTPAKLLSAQPTPATTLDSRARARSSPSPLTGFTPPATQLAAHLNPPATQLAAHSTPPATELAAHLNPPATQLAGQSTPPATKLAETPPATQLAAHLTPAATQLAAHLNPPATELAGQSIPPATQLAAHLTPPATQLAGQSTPPATELAAHLTPPATQLAAHLNPPATQLAAHLSQIPHPATVKVADAASTVQSGSPAELGVHMPAHCTRPATAMPGCAWAKSSSFPATASVMHNTLASGKVDRAASSAAQHDRPPPPLLAKFDSCANSEPAPKDAGGIAAEEPAGHSHGSAADNALLAGRTVVLPSPQPCQPPLGPAYPSHSTGCRRMRQV